jgi:alpha-L-rhamnosidase
MGLLVKNDWKGKWIGLKNILPGTITPPTSYLRKGFKISKKINKAIIYSTSRGIYELYLNGKRVGEDIFTPGWTDYNKRIQYQVYDVTKLLQDKRNCIGVILGDGWYSGFIGYVGRRAIYGNQTCILMQMYIEYSNGTEEILSTDSTWKCSTGPILRSDFLMGEDYDARKEINGWDEPDFNDKKWNNVIMVDNTDAELVAQPCESVQITQLVKPKNISQPLKGSFVFDLGQNIVGFVKLKVKGKPGTVVIIKYAEMLNPDGTIYTDNLRAARSTDTYILKGKGIETFQPRFTFHGFRYVEITGYPGNPTLDAITGCMINSALPTSGKFECSNPMVNQLQSNITWGQRGNFISIPTDCPQRDERLGWMGDAQIFVRTATFNMDVSGFFTKWIKDIKDGQSKLGAFTDIVPYVQGLVPEGGAPAWADAGVIVPWTIYQCYGDTRIIENHYDAMEKWMNYVYEENKDFIRRNRLNNNYGDWLSIDADTPGDLLATAYWAYDAKLMYMMSKAIGKTDDEKKYTELFENIKAAFLKEYVSTDGHVKGNTQTAYVLALYMDLLPEELKEKSAQYLVKDIESKGWHLSTGFIGVRHLNLVLTNAGYDDMAYRLLNITTFPSWVYSIKQGATTIWERWDGWTKEKGFQDPGMNSFNHYALGSVGEWLFRYVAGIDIDPEYPGYKSIAIHPYPGGSLKYAKAEYNSIYGKIISHWKIEKDMFYLYVTIPANTTARVNIPTSDISSIKENDKEIKSIEDIKFLRFEKGFAIYEIGSGSYSFTSKFK